MRFPAFFRLMLLAVYLSGAFAFIPAYGHRDTLRGNDIAFIENKGQWPDQVLYMADINNGHIYVEKGGLTYDFRDEEAFSAFVGYKFLAPELKNQQKPPTGMVDHFAYRVRFEGASENPVVSASDPYPGIYNYFLGNDPGKWASEVQRFASVRYGNLYPNTDLVIARDESLFKYEFRCHQGSDPSTIRLVYDGVNDLSLKYGNLVITTPLGRVYELKPYAYQVVAGEKQKVECTFRLKNNVLTYRLGKYDPSLTLVIDPPVRIFASYTGSTADNWGYTATFDDLGYLYSGGNAFNNGYPVSIGAYQSNYAGATSDIAISKFDTTGSFLVFSTYLGGSGTEVPQSLIVNSQGQLFVLGTTGSSDFPVTPGAFDQTFNGGPGYTLTSILQYQNGSDIIISKLSANGSQLLGSTYVGGSGIDGLNTQVPLKHNYADDVRGEIILDDFDNVVVISSTQSANFPATPGSVQAVKNGGQDAVLFKMDNQLSSMIWGTYLGGNAHDAGYSIASDSQGAIYASGGTSSTDFPVTSGVLQNIYQGGNCDGWIAKISPNGNTLQHSTFYGASGYDQVYFVDMDNAGNVYVLGQTDATGNTWVTNASWYTLSGGQFISKLNSSLSQKIWSTAFGSGNGPDISPTAFMVDLCNRVYLSGWGGPAVNHFGGTSGLPVTPDAFQLTTDNNDYYFMIMKDDASGLAYATFYGGSQSAEHVDGGTSRFDSKGRIYQAVCAGCGGNSDFPTSPGAWSNTNNSTNCNLGAVVFDFLTPAVVADFIDPPSICAPDTITFVNTSQIPPSASPTYYWSFGDGTFSSLHSPVKIYTQSGIYQVTLIVADNGACNFSDTITKQVVVLSGISSILTPKEICKNNSIQIGILPINDPSVTYLWTPPIHLNNSSISNPVASPPSTLSYVLMVSNGVCTDTFLQQVIVYDLVVDAGPDVSVCQGSVQLTATTPNTNVQFHWSDNPAFSSMLNISPNNPSCVITLNTPQYYYVKIYNAICEAFDSVYVDQLVKFTSVVTQDPNCHGICDGITTVTMAGGTPPYQYQWSGSSSTTATATGLCAGTHFVTVTDALGCYGVSQFVLTDPPLLESAASSHNAPCEEVCIGKGFSNATGGTPPYQYLWSDPLQQQTSTAYNLCPGVYQVTITDSKGCTATDQVTVEDSSIYVILSVEVSKDTVFEGQSVQLTATWLGPGYAYQWIPPKWLSNPSIHNPMATPFASITYKVVVTDQWGCIFTDSIDLTVLEVFCDDPYIYVPNAFTPNGDMMNDVLYVYTIYAEELYFAIFNRWGEKVFETTNKDRGWDGTFKGREVDPGVFDYYLEVRCYNKVQFKKKGNITLIR
ncbi:MAG: gliding motility-associated C-terminal domain-containing protein [Bacteroidales bacterium]